MIWDEKMSNGLVWNIAKPPSFYGMPYLMAIVIFSEQQLTHNRRSLTETEILDIQNRCEQLYDLCGE